jgi:hypothetical protein
MTITRPRLSNPTKYEGKTMARSFEIFFCRDNFRRKYAFLRRKRIHWEDKLKKERKVAILGYFLVFFGIPTLFFTIAKKL